MLNRTLRSLNFQDYIYYVLLVELTSVYMNPQIL